MGFGEESLFCALTLHLISVDFDFFEAFEGIWLVSLVDERLDLGFLTGFPTEGGFKTELCNCSITDSGTIPRFCVTTGAAGAGVTTVGRLNWSVFPGGR